MTPAHVAKGLPWVPCCASCAQGGAAGAVGDTPAPSSGGGVSSSTLAILTLGGIFLAVVYGEKILGKLGG